MVCSSCLASMSKVSRSSRYLVVGSCSPPSGVRHDWFKKETPGQRRGWWSRHFRLLHRVTCAFTCYRVQRRNRPTSIRSNAETIGRMIGSSSWGSSDGAEFKGLAAARSDSIGASTHAPSRPPTCAFADGIGPDVMVAAPLCEGPRTTGSQMSPHFRTPAVWPIDFHERASVSSVAAE